MTLFRLLFYFPFLLLYLFVSQCWLHEDRFVATGINSANYGYQICSHKKNCTMASCPVVRNARVIYKLPV